MRWGGLRGRLALEPTALVERCRERLGGHPVESEHRPHIEAALAWLLRAQNATPDDGIARGYSVTWNPYFRARGWQPSYPETTGYIIPTLYHAAGYLCRPELAERAERAARWEISVQLLSGAVRGGVIGEEESSAVFNTGQVILGWLSALAATGDGLFASAVRPAATYLVSVQDADGQWRRGNSRFARSDSTAYNARAAWALAEAGVWLDEPSYLTAAARQLEAVARLQRANGWIPQCCLTDPDRPLLHTLAYAIRGLIEGGRVLDDDSLLRRGALGAEALAASVRADGWMAGRYDRDWRPVVSWSCLTGQAQMANNWLRLYLITGETKWLEPVARVLRFLKRTQNRGSRDPGLRGGIKGSAPLSGEYGRYQVLSWATKYFVDALIRDEQIRTSGRAGSPHDVLA